MNILGEEEEERADDADVMSNIALKQGKKGFAELQFQGTIFFLTTDEHSLLVEKNGEIIIKRVNCPYK